MCYFRDLTTSPYSSSQWKLYNDTGITSFYTFKDLIIDCAETL
jgi:rubrerythrin